MLPEEKPQIDKRYTAVLERVQPGYVPPDIPLGSFRMAPSIALTTAYDDNIFGTQADPVADASLHLQPQVQLQSQWSRNSLSLDAQGTIDRYLARHSEDIADYSVTARSVVELDHATTLTTAVRAESDHQSRLSQDIFSQTLRPIYYTQQSGAAVLSRDFGKLRLSTTARVARFDFRDGRLVDGTLSDQQPSDNMSYRAGVRASYAQTPSIAWFTSASYNVRRFRTGNLQTPKRDSQGFELLAGVTFEPAALIRGSIGIGYIQQRFRLPFYTNIGGVGFNASVQVFPTQLTTVTLRGNRSVLDSGIPGSGGYLSTRGSVQVDHEWLRQLILSASLSYENNRFNNLARVDDRIGAQASATYRMNRFASLKLGYARLDQSSNGTDRYRAFKDDRVTIGLTLTR
nr:MULTISPECIES: outer membrane beta-barrel protein [unclassified Sphingomonas]